MNPSYEALEFPAILAQLQSHALSEEAQRQLAKLSPILNEDLCRRKMAEVTAARAILEGVGTPPLSPMKGLNELLSLALAGAMLTPEQLCAVATFASSCKKLKSYLRRGESCGADVAVYGRNLCDLSALQAEIEQSVNEDQVFDDASPALKAIRRKLERLDGQIKEKLNHALQSKKQFLAESFISIRGGHYVLPVQRRYQSQFGGTVIDVSGKGGTVFMEPSSVVNLQAEKGMLEMEEDGEVRRVLYTLTALVADREADLRNSMALMVTLDELFAKAKYSVALKARPVEITGGRQLRIVKGRHPLLSPEACVPLDLSMDENCHGVIITGPNTGGKTVALKTVGLLTLMAQSGLHIPCGERTAIAMEDGVYCDIGDSQDISQNLSTFSGHMTNVISILQSASKDSLVLLDELGSGTDPTEGVGIAVAVLKELARRGCHFLVTTHYPKVKTFAEETPEVVSARMAFDRETLTPLYRLEMGKSGESCALHIVQRLGMAPCLLAQARHEVYGTPLTAEAPMPAPPSRLKRTAPARETDDPSLKFQLGDSVQTLPSKDKGIVFRPANEQGDVIVQIRGVKCAVKHTRLELIAPAGQLYPPDYDFSILFDTVENRKARHSMDRRFDAQAVITHEAEAYPPYDQVDWGRVGR